MMIIMYVCTSAIFIKYMQLLSSTNLTMQQYGYALVYVHASTLSSFYIHLHDCSLSDERHTLLPQLATAVFRTQAVMIEIFDIPCSSYKNNEYITPFHHHNFNSNNSDFIRKAKNLYTTIFQGYIDIQNSSICILQLGMSLFCFFSHLFFFLAILFFLTYYAQYFARNFNILLKVQLSSQLLNRDIIQIHTSTACTHHGQLQLE